jgi:hypothetical protein
MTQTRVPKNNAVPGQYTAFDLIGRRPTRSKAQVPLASRRDVERELKSAYLREQLFNVCGSEIEENTCDTIRRECCLGVEAIVLQKIDDEGRGSHHDTRLRSLQTNLRAVKKSLQKLQKGEIDAVASAIDSLIDEDERRRRFVALRMMAEYLFTGRRLREPLPPALSNNALFNQEASERDQHPAEFWFEIMLQLMNQAETWVATAARNPTARNQAGRPKNEPLNELAMKLYPIYSDVEEPERASYGRFERFLDIVLGPLIPREHLPGGGFKSLATTTGKKFRPPS